MTKVGNLETYLKVGLDAAKQAGAYLREIQLPNIHRYEKNGTDFLTEHDLAAQSLLFNIINGKFPAHYFLGEEVGEGRNQDSIQATKKSYIWVADPIDGTFNFLYGGEHYSCALSLLEIQEISENSLIGEVLVGIVHKPKTEDTYWAVSGDNAYKNGEVICPSQSRHIGEWLITFGYPSCTALNKAREYEKFKTNLTREFPSGDTKRPHKIDIWKPGSGSMALELCYLAEGAVNGIARFQQSIWDIAGGLLIAKQAGAYVTLDGKVWDGKIIVDRDRKFNVVGTGNQENYETLTHLMHGGEFQS